MDAGALQKQVFRKFVGRDPVGPVRAIYTFKNQNDKFVTTLVLSDDRGSKPLPLHYDANDPEAFGLISIMQETMRVLTPSSNLPNGCAMTDAPWADYGTLSRHIDAGTAYGSIRAADGSQYPVTMDFNVKNDAIENPLQLKYLLPNGKRVDLFQMDLDE
jgi:hypothetical protein